MLELVAVTYGAVTSFVLASASRNKREARGNPPILTLFGLVLMTFSAAMAAMLLGYMAWDGLVV